MSRGEWEVALGALKIMEDPIVSLLTCHLKYEKYLITQTTIASENEVGPGPMLPMDGEDPRSGGPDHGSSPSGGFSSPRSGSESGIWKSN